MNCTFVPAGPLAGVADSVTVRPPEVSLAEAVWGAVVGVDRAVVVVTARVVVVVAGRAVLVVVVMAPTLVVGGAEVVEDPADVGGPVFPTVVGAP